jgi:TolB-like protein/DNA-binding winged helix-turn-helix (wHTH) protein/tetratricopeptide (TPR) repeat protein
LLIAKGLLESVTILGEAFCSRQHGATLSPTSWFSIMALPTRSRIVSFGVFDVDLQEGEVRRAGLRQKLGPQPFQLLRILLERPGELVTRDELREQLWPDNTFVDYDLGLKRCLNRIREVLGDSAENPRYIQTIPRRGYRFIAPLQEVSPYGSAALPLTASENQTPAIPDVQAPDHAETAVRRIRRPTAVIGALLLSTALTVAVYFARRQVPAREEVATAQIKALAVLPLENLTTDSDSDYYAEGMTDELITQLAKLNGVRVISRTSVMPFEGKRMPLQEIARALNVDAIVEGTILRSGGRVRITAQLIQIHPEKHLWAESYESPERNVLDLQGDLAENIARKISGTIRRGQQTSTPISVEAHEAYLRGRYWWHRRGREAEAKGLQYFQRAVEIDPSYAAGWAGIADSYLVMAHHGGLLPNEAMPKAKTAAMKALELDNSLAEAHNSLALVKLSYDWDYPGAESEFKRAIELDPNYATAHHWYAHYLVIAGRFDEALNEIQLAHQLDPYSEVINIWWGRIYYYQGDYQRAIAQFQSMLELDPAFGPMVFGALAEVYEQQGNYARAIEEHQRAFSAIGRPQDGVALANAYAAGGADLYWRERIRQSQLAAAGAPEPTLALAIDYARSRNGDAALNSLERAYREQSPWLNFMEREPAFEWLRTEPRFQKLAANLRLK